MERLLEISWRHTPDQEAPCLACTDTKRTFSELLEYLLPAFQEDGITVRFSEVKVDAGNNPPENEVLLNGIPIGPLLSYAAVGEEYCHASKCMPAEHIHRRYPGPGGVFCDEAPEVLFRKAIVLSFDDEVRSHFLAYE